MLETATPVSIPNYNIEDRRYPPRFEIEHRGSVLNINREIGCEDLFNAA
jgi:hypothetical protein